MLSTCLAPGTKRKSFSVGQSAVQPGVYVEIHVERVEIARHNVVIVNGEVSRPSRRAYALLVILDIGYRVQYVRRKVFLFVHEYVLEFALGIVRGLRNAKRSHSRDKADENY